MIAIIVLVIVGVLVVGGLLWAVLAYNGLVTARNRIEGAYAQIDVQLHRRHDLIPNLVETVKGYAAHERDTLEAVIAARNAAMSAGTPAEAAQAENVVTGALRSLFALSEAYPQLQANENFGQLQAELAATEDRIAYARQYYNDNVRTYNTRIETVPTVVVARMAGFAAREYFAADEDARGGVAVDFGS